MKKGWICSVLLLWLWLLPALPAGAASPPDYRIVNMVDDFLVYYQECRDMNVQERTDAWETMLEAKYPQFFQDALYRRKTGADRERYKEICISRFWEEVAPRIDTIAALNRGVGEKNTPVSG